MAKLNTSSAHLLKAAVDQGIVSPAELASLMGNAEVETNGFRTMRENLVYSDVDRVLETSRSAAKRYSAQEIEEAVKSKDPERMATILYEGRNEGDLGNSEVGDGYRFHGRGHFQITGRYNYEAFGGKIGVDLISDPELAVEPEISAKLAVAYWKERVPKEVRGDPMAAGIKINGGKHGLERRGRAARSWASLITPDLIQGIQSGSLGVNDLAAMGAEEVDVSKQGERTRVEGLQRDLNRLGYVDAAGCELKVDGDYGRRTRLAVEDFQRRHGLAADGIAGPLTLAAVGRAVEKEIRSIGQPDAPYLQPKQPSEALSPYRSLSPEPHAMPSMPIVSLDDHVRSASAFYSGPQAHSLEMASSQADGRGQLSRDTTTVHSSFSASSARGLDWQDPRHPKSELHELYSELGRRVPDASEDRLLQFTAACHESCITARNLVGARLDEQLGTLTFIGTGPLTQPACIDLTSPPPYAEEAIQQIQQHDLQQQQVMEQVRSQQAQMGMSHSR